MLFDPSPISLLSSLLGLGAIGVLFALHHLKTQPARRAVATLIFWQQNAREQRSRMLWSRRFTHWRTFLLLSLIALVLAASLSADRWGRSDDVDCVIVVDTGTSMAGRSSDGRPALDLAIDAVRRDVKGLSFSPTLIAAGPSPLVLSRAGAATSIFDDKLGQLACTNESSNSASALELASSLLSDRDGTIEWYTNRDALPAGLPIDIARQVHVRRLPAPTQAVAIAGVTFVPAGAGGLRGVVRIRLAGRSDTPATLNMTVGGMRRSKPVGSIAGQVDIAFDEIAADGQVATIELTDAPGATATHTARYELPNRPAFRFYILGAIPRPLRAALAAIGSEVTSPVGAVVVTSQEKASLDFGTRSIVVVDAGDLKPVASPIAVAVDAPRTISSIDFQGATAMAGQAIPSSARTILVADSVPVAGIDSGNSGARLYLSTALIGDNADLPRSAAFPELIARLADELEGGQAAAPVVSAERLAEDPLWPPAPPTAPVAVVFGTPMTATMGDAAPSESPLLRNALGTKNRWPWGTILIAAGLILLMGEELLLAAKKII